MLSSLKNIYGIVTACLIFSIIGCDPGHHGTVYIVNQSTESLVLSFKTNHQDTTFTIPANTSKQVLRFGGLGEGRGYVSPIYEYKEIHLTTSDSSKAILKNILDIDNWQMTNENIRRYSAKPIECWFTITNKDIN